MSEYIGVPSMQQLVRCSLDNARAFIDYYGVDAFVGMGFFYAAKNPDLRVIQLFIDSGIDPKNPPKGYKGDDCVYMHAIRAKNRQVVTMLLDCGVVVHQLVRVLDKAIADNSKDHFELLFPHASHDQACHVLRLALDYRIDCWFASHILKSGFDIRKDHQPLGLLFQIMLRFHEILADYDKVDYNVCNRFGSNICHELVKVRHKTTRSINGRKVNPLAFVIQNGADVFAVDGDNLTSMDHCIRFQPECPDHIILFLAGVEMSSSKWERVSSEWEKTNSELASGAYQPPSEAFRVLTTYPRTDADRRTLCLITRLLYYHQNNNLVRQYIDAQANAIIQSRGIEICIGLQARELPLLQTIEILQAYFWMWPRIPFHCYWNLAFAVKHFVPHHAKKKRCTNTD